MKQMGAVPLNAETFARAAGGNARQPTYSMSRKQMGHGYREPTAPGAREKTGSSERQMGAGVCMPGQMG